MNKLVFAMKLHKDLYVTQRKTFLICVIVFLEHKKILLLSQITITIFDDALSLHIVVRTDPIFRIFIGHHSGYFKLRQFYLDVLLSRSKSFYLNDCKLNRATFCAKKYSNICTILICRVWLIMISLFKMI